MIQTTIETHALSILKGNENFSFSNEPDLYEHFKKHFVKFIDNTDGVNPAAKKLIRIPKAKKQKPFWGYDDSQRIIYGVVKSGIYDKIYDIADIRDKDYILTTKKSNAVMKPFFYFIKIPRNHNKALLILERVENDGIYSIFSTILKLFLQNTFIQGKYEVKKESIITNEYLKELNEGVYKSISMKVLSLPKDIADRYFSQELETENFSIELKIKFKNAKNEQTKIKNLIRTNALITSVDMNGLFADAKKSLTSTFGNTNKTRTYHLNEENREMIRPYYDLEVEENDEGFSNFDSILGTIQNFINDNTEFQIFN